MEGNAGVERRWSEGFRVSWGSVPGREHLRLGRNNQDGLAVHLEDDLIAAAVTDGCSAAPESEVGARLAAAWLAAHAPRLWRHDPSGFPAALEAALRGFLERSVTEITSAGLPREAVLQRFFLFGFLLVVMDPGETMVVGAGDGVLSMDGEHEVLQPGEGNAPDYPGYALLGTGAGRLRVHAHRSTRGLDSLLLATDGAVPLVGPAVTSPGSLFTTSGRLTFPDRPRALQKRLNVLGSRPGLLGDDTTLVHLERRAAA